MVEEFNVAEPTSKGPGTLYVMHEEDYLTKETFSYYKIGIVRGDRDVQSREKDHKTGNPRSIKTKFELQCEQVQKLETLLHNKYAPFRVSSGEWFYLDEVQLSTMWADAQTYGQLLDSRAEVVERGKELKKLEVREGSVKSTHEISELISQIMECSIEYDYLEDISKIVVNALKEAYKKDTSIEYLMKRSERKAKRDFSVSILKEKFPDLYQKYLETSQSWTPEYLIEATELKGKTLALTSSIFGTTEEIQMEKEPQKLHRKFLELWSRKSVLSLQIEIAEAEVIDYCGAYAQIDNLFTWKSKTINKINKTNLKNDLPDIYEQCFKDTPASVTYAVAEWASYRQVGNL